MFKHKHVWIVGAASGIGQRTVEHFHQAGALVTAIDRNPQNNIAVHRCVTLDVSNHYDVAANCRELLKSGAPIDILINAAGVLHLGNMDELSLTDWHASFASNVFAAFYLMRELTPVFKRQRFGSIVHIASNAAQTPRMNMTAYCPSKAALVSFSHCLALELAPFGVRCNVVSPGSTLTPMLHNMLGDEDAKDRLITGDLHSFKLGIPLGKVAETEDVVNAIAFLASDQAGHITMHNLVVDGGATLAR